MDLNIRGRKAVITGGSRGIGRAVAARLAAEGADGHLVARTSATLEVAVSELKNDYGINASFSALDLSERANVDRLFVDCSDPIDILVNNAGVLGPVGPSHEVAPGAWFEAIRINLGGCFLCSRAVLPGMIGRRDGRIINLSGGGAVSPRPWFSAYGASKAAIERFTEPLAAEVADHGVQVNAISPGAVNTHMPRGAWRRRGRRRGTAAGRRRHISTTGGRPGPLPGILQVCGPDGTAAGGALG